MTFELKALMSVLAVPRKSLFESGFQLESSEDENQECDKAPACQSPQNNTSYLFLAPQNR